MPEGRLGNAASDGMPFVTPNLPWYVLRLFLSLPVRAADTFSLVTDRWNAGVRYSQRTRAFHHDIVTKIFRFHHKSLMANLSRLLVKCVLVVDLRQARAPTEEEVTATGIPGYLKSPEIGDNPFMRSRVEEMVKEFEASKEEDVWLVELRLPWNEVRMVALLVEVVKRAGEFIVRQSVVHVP
jgi:hypothetical protein